MDVVASSLPELREFMPWAQEMPTREAEVDFLRTTIATFDLGTDFGYGMFEPDDVLVGSCGLHRFAPAVCQIGYFVCTDRTRRGYATAAAGALTAACFAHLPDIERIEIHCDATNLASAAVPRKLGYDFAAEVDRPIEAVGHTGRGFVFAMTRA